MLISPLSQTYCPYPVPGPIPVPCNISDISPLSNINNKNKHTNIQTTNNQHEHEHEHTDWFDPRINIRVNDVVMSVNSYDVRGSRTKTMLAAFSFKQPKDPGTCVC